MSKWDDIVEAAMHKSGGDNEETPSHILNTATIDYELSEHLCYLGACYLIRDYRRRSREVIKQPPHNIVVRMSKAEVKTYLQTIKKGNPFWNYALYNGTPLAKATRPMLLLSIEAHEKQRAGHKASIRFERQLADILPNDTITAEEFLKDRASLAAQSILSASALVIHEP